MDPVIAVTEEMLSELPEWRRSLGLKLMDQCDSLACLPCRHRLCAESQGSSSFHGAELLSEKRESSSSTKRVIKIVRNTCLRQLRILAMFSYPHGLHEPFIRRGS